MILKQVLLFEEKFVIDSSGCWVWTAAHDQNGYGKVRIDKVLHAAHRVAFRWCRGPIPDGMELDHLCRNRACVNPDHLEPVSHRENVLRGESPAALNPSKTRCPNGHEYDEANTYVNPKRGHRGCRACRRIGMRRAG